jgi:hypothetical protein
MDVVAMIVAALLAVPLLAMAIAHLMWSVGIMWPIRDPALLARTVTGRPGPPRMPGKPLSFGVFVLTLAACVVGFAVADPTSGGLGLTLLAGVAAIGFLGRGIIGYTAWWQARTPEHPFRAIDRKTYSPLCLAIGLGFLLLVIMRLI